MLTSTRPPIVTENYDPEKAREALQAFLEQMPVVRSDSVLTALVETDASNWRITFSCAVAGRAEGAPLARGAVERMQLEKPDFGRDYHFLVTFNNGYEEKDRVLYRNFSWHDGLRIVGTHLNHFLSR
jgi:hypothetical protein